MMRIVTFEWMRAMTSVRQRRKTSQPRATPWVAHPNERQAPTGRNKHVPNNDNAYRLSRPFRAGALFHVVPRALPWAGFWQAVGLKD